jgi:hypothetical protein
MLGFGEVGHATEILPGTHDKRPAALPRWAFLPSEGDLRLHMNMDCFFRHTHVISKMKTTRGASRIYCPKGYNSAIK